MEGRVAPLGSSPTFSDSSSYVGLTLTNKQSVAPHIERNLWVANEWGHEAWWLRIVSGRGQRIAIAGF